MPGRGYPISCLQTVHFAPCIAGCERWKNKSFQHHCGKRCGKSLEGGTGGCGRPVGTLPACAQARGHLPKGEAFCPLRSQKAINKSKQQKAAARTGAAAFSTLILPNAKSSPSWMRSVVLGPSAWHPGHAGGRQSRGRARWNAGRRSASHGRRDCRGSHRARHHGRHGRCGASGAVAAVTAVSITAGSRPPSRRPPRWLRALSRSGRLLALGSVE